MTTTTYTTVDRNTGEEKQITSKFGPAELLQELRTLCGFTGKFVDGVEVKNELAPLFRNDFAGSLAGSRSLSPAQSYWAAKLIEDAQNTVSYAQQVPTSSVVSLLNAAKLRMDAAAEKRGVKAKGPKIRLMTTDGQKLVLSLCGDRSKNKGCVQITDGGPWGESVYFGKVTPSGEFVQTRAATPGVLDAVAALADDPQRAAMTYGAITNTCCFCGKGLTTDASVGAGYGPKCAVNWGMSWGEETAARCTEIKAELAEVAAS